MVWLSHITTPPAKPTWPEKGDFRPDRGSHRLDSFIQPESNSGLLPGVPTLHDSANTQYGQRLCTGYHAVGTQAMAGGSQAVPFRIFYYPEVGGIYVTTPQKLGWRGAVREKVSNQ